MFMEETERNKIIDNEIRRLSDILKEVDSKKRRTAKGLIEECGFMKATLIELKGIIAESGVINEMPQGEYSILREHPALKSYNATIQRYTTVIDKLMGLLPKDAQKPDDDLSSLVGFLNERDD